ncbi:MAG: hypothetical protein U0768_12455 [Anaerolineae bacterium]
MKGIQYVTDEAGKRTAVIISLAEWGAIWEDMYDIIVSESRKGEPSVAWDDLKAEMDRDEANGGALPG